MRFKLFQLLFLLACVAAVSARANKPAAIDWHDTTRDVYIANEIDRAAQVLASDSPSRLALVSSKLDRAIVLNINEQTISAVSKDAFHFSADRTSATSDGDAKMEAIGKFTRLDGPIYFFAVDGKPILIRAHPGLTGEMTIEKLWETVPVWRAEMENYQPSAEAVAAIKASDKDANVTLIYGTWCPDSKNYMPRLIKALQAAGNTHVHLKLIGVDNQFHEPVDTVQPRAITNVPTVIVERDGREIGRIVETPAAKTIEEDLAAILSGKAIVHNGRWERGPMLARGAYSYRDANGKEVGSETWELFSTTSGGLLAHSRVTMNDVTTEVFHEVEANRRPKFVEVTKQHGPERTRTRHTVDRRTMTARMRGSNSGVILQTVEVPEQFFLSSPAVVAQGWLPEPVSSHSGKNVTASYAAPAEFNRAMGTLAQMSFETKNDESVKVPCGEFRARHITRKMENQISEWWLHPQLGIPVRGQVPGGVQFILTSLEIAPPNK